jgi:electron transfer flavoprotein alpha subunit
MIFVIAEQKDGALNRASWEAVAAAQQLGGPLTIVVAGSGVSGVATELAAAEAAEVIALEHEALAVYTADGFVAALAALIKAESPTHVVLAHTYQTRDFAPRLAARLDVPLAADCVGLKPGAGGAAHTYVRLMFQGKVSADVVLEGEGAHIVTFQIGAFRVDAAKKGSAPASVRQVAAACWVSLRSSRMPQMR